MLRPFQTSDASQLDSLLDAEPDPLFRAQGHRLHGADRDGDRWRRSLIAERDGRLVGVVSAARNPVHPGRYSCAVEVSTAARRQHLGRMLLAEIQTLLPERLPLSGKVRPGDRAALELLAAVGGGIYQTCPGLRPDPASAQIQAWCAAQPLPDGVTLVPLSTLDTSVQLSCWIEFYLWNHASWSPADPVELGQLGVELLDGLLPALSVCAMRDGRPAAISWVFEETPSSVTVVAETVRATEPAGAKLVAATLASCLTNLHGAGLDGADIHRAGNTTVDLDGHITDPHLMPVLHTMPATATDPLLLVEIPPAH
ncbi:MAG: GNAT family N-acetyltransferase [Actinomycetota bacterium]|nr:GNAT family N-acetyltransferase [Actinomycetota bacterium]MDQ2846914.1 GNAT family N-acetyltransferase [Actinomycetota bacterium]MDQ2958574.1 GNAT family N-acetyltransferase [Actinomycetota bacterium]